MRHRIATLAVALTAVLGAGAAGPAQATTHPSHSHVRPALSDFGPNRFFVGGYNLCIVTNGVAKQLTVKNPAGNYCARISGLIAGYSGGSPVYLLQDGSGNCLRANDYHAVNIDVCNPGDNGEQWQLVYGSICTGCTTEWYNFAQNADMKVDSPPTDGWKVWVGTDIGSDYGWYLARP